MNQPSWNVKRKDLCLATRMHQKSSPSIVVWMQQIILSGQPQHSSEIPSSVEQMDLCDENPSEFKVQRLRAYWLQNAISSR